MKTVGIDLAAQAPSTAGAVIDWSADGARLNFLECNLGDDALIALSSGAARVGVDSPFGWPDAFAALIADHHAGRISTTPVATAIDRIPLTRRLTDIHIHQTLGIRPLSVSADLIAHVAIRCTGLLAALDVTDRANGWAIESYPAGALRHWGFTHRGYKGSKGAQVRELMLEDLRSSAPWLDLNGYDDAMIANDDLFDAVIVALIARAATLGFTELPSPDQLDVAQREGWAHVPTCSLRELIDSGR